MPLDVADLHFRTESLSGKAFFSQGSLVAAAAQFPYVQLWNPATSGVNVYLRNIIPFDNSATSHQTYCGVVTAALAGSIMVPTNKIPTGPAAKAQLITLSSASNLIPNVSIILNYNGSNAAWMPQTLEFENSIILPPGYGITLGNLITAASELGATFQWLEQ